MYQRVSGAVKGAGPPGNPRGPPAALPMSASLRLLDVTVVDLFPMAGKQLSEYRAKRDFTKTAEPSGSALVRPAEASSLRHSKTCRDAAALRSAARIGWRVQVLGGYKGSVDRSQRDKRLAVEVEDHPTRLWGFRRDHSQRPIRRRHRDAVGSRLSGRRSVTKIPSRHFATANSNSFSPEKNCKGSWVLVRLKNDRAGNGKRNNWLLIKHRDEVCQAWR